MKPPLTLVALEGASAENGLKDWVVTGSTIASATGGYTTANCAKIGPTPGTLAQSLSCRPGDQIYLEGFAQSFSANAPMYLDLTFWDAAGALLSGEVIGTALHTTGGWQKLIANGTAPAGTASAKAAMVADGSLSAGYWLVDSMFLARQTPTGPGAIPDGNGGVRLNTEDLSNMALNGDFSLALYGWTPASGWSLAVGQGQGGGDAAKVVPAGGALSQSWFTALPNTQYYVEAWVKAAAATDGSCYVFSQCFQGDRTTDLGNSPTGAGTYFQVTAAVASGWTKVSGVFTTPANTGAFKLHIYIGPASGFTTGTWYVDNIVLRRQTTTGDGMQADGAGGVKVKITSGLVIDGSGNIKVKNGSGIAFDGSGNVTVNKGIGLDVDGSGFLVVKPSTGLTVDGSGVYIPGGAITNSLLAALSVATAQLQSGAVTDAKVASVGTSKLFADPAKIGTALIANAAITNALLGTAVVGTANIQNAAITNALIASAAIGSAQIQNGAITNAHITDLQVSKITGWNGANVSVSSGFYFNGTGGNSVFIGNGAIITTVSVTTDAVYSNDVAATTYHSGASAGITTNIPPGKTIQVAGGIVVGYF
jgi:hypothetical protein